MIKDMDSDDGARCDFCLDHSKQPRAQFQGTECGQWACDRHLLALVVGDHNALCAKLTELRDEHDTVEGRVAQNEIDISRNRRAAL